MLSCARPHYFSQCSSSLSPLTLACIQIRVSVCPCNNCFPEKNSKNTIRMPRFVEYSIHMESNSKYLIIIEFCCYLFGLVCFSCWCCCSCHSLNILWLCSYCCIIHSKNTPVTYALITPLLLKLDFVFLSAHSWCSFALCVLPVCAVYICLCLWWWCWNSLNFDTYFYTIRSLAHTIALIIPIVRWS